MILILNNKNFFWSSPTYLFCPHKLRSQTSKARREWKEKENRRIDGSDDNDLKVYKHAQVQ